MSLSGLLIRIGLTLLAVSIIVTAFGTNWYSGYAAGTIASLILASGFIRECEK